MSAKKLPPKIKPLPRTPKKSAKKQLSRTERLVRTLPAQLAKYPLRYLTWYRSRRRLKKIAIWIAAVIVVFLALYNIIDFATPEVKNPNYGVSFSITYAEELGNNWQDNYLALLNDMHFKHLRLMSYWDMYEPQKGHYNFDSLDWQVNQAAQHGAKVSLAIGWRQPRWPECHEPDWAKQLPAESPQWQSDLSQYIQVVVNRYKNNPALESYQLENESLNTWFGDCRTKAANRDRLISEFNLVKHLDPNHPVLMSLSDEHGFPVHGPTPDAFGISVYRIVWNDKTPIHFYLTYPAPVWWHRLRGEIIKLTKHRDIYIHELQVEPWGPKPTLELSVAEQDRSMSVTQIHKNMRFGRQVGAKDIYTWGAEWWYWRKVHFHDPGPWNAVKEEIGSSGGR
jgi:hypothetical protein